MKIDFLAIVNGMKRLMPVYAHQPGAPAFAQLARLWNLLAVVLPEKFDVLVAIQWDNKQQIISNIENSLENREKYFPEIFGKEKVKSKPVKGIDKK